MEVVNRPRSKTFVSMNSLWYEEERLATFIDWPVTFISYRELAREGFYYLRTKDHCACAFCRGIIGAWEQGDTPRGEHMRHFPHCDFVIKGKVTPNVPLKQGIILSRVSREITSDSHNFLKSGDEDVCGTGRLEELQIDARSDLGRCTGVLKSSNPELSMKSLGLRQYCGPKRKEYLTAEVRLNSFTNWPEKVKQTPKDLADAGFHYCGISDHVRCFHCGNGLRNFELEDDPWEEHARWFPRCHFVLLRKGIEFVDKVRREKPPFIPFRSTPPTPGGASTSGATHEARELSDDEMEKLMELEIMKHVLEMGFARHVVKVALRKRVMETGQPFFTVQLCIDDILMAMEKETCNAISGCEDITAQAKKIAAYEQASTRPPGSANTSTGHNSGVASLLSSSSSSASSSSSSRPSDSTASSSQGSGHSSETVPQNIFPLPNNNNNNNNIMYTPAASQSSLPPLPSISRASPPLRSSTPTSQMATATTPQSMEVEEEEQGEVIAPISTPANAEVETGTLDSEDVLPEEPQQAEENMQQAEENMQQEQSDDSTMELPSEVVPLFSEADDIMEETAKHLCPSSASSQPSSLTSNGSESSQSSSSASASSAEQEIESERLLAAAKQTTTAASSQDEGKSNSERSQRTETLALELEQIKENRVCKVCMDKEMDVVFLPCTHMVTCSSCAVALAACPICRRDIQYAFKPIIS